MLGTGQGMLKPWGFFLAFLKFYNKLKNDTLSLFDDYDLIIDN